VVSQWPFLRYEAAADLGQYDGVTWRLATRVRTDWSCTWSPKSVGRATVLKTRLPFDIAGSEKRSWRPAEDADFFSRYKRTFCLLPVGKAVVQAKVLALFLPTSISFYVFCSWQKVADHQGSHLSKLAEAVSRLP